VAFREGFSELARLRQSTAHAGCWRAVVAFAPR